MKITRKYFLAFFAIMCTQIGLFACPVCDKQQPEITQGITHGTGPQSYWDWVIIATIILITVMTLFFSIKYLIKPGEKGPNHIKQIILNNK